MANETRCRKIVPSKGTWALLSVIAVTLTNASDGQTPSGNTSEPERRSVIEEVIVTAERRESTVSDTSISITALTGDFLEDFGIRNQEDLQKLIPAAIIEPYDISIRGVGRNFRTLGGDPGVATYLNGVYSEDFGIASTEGGLNDIERIEVLRGPQGTLYGRNAIGGAVNFINKRPTEEFEAEFKTIVGDGGLYDLYGVLSGPVIPSVLAARFTGSKRVRDGYTEDIGVFAEDADNFGDENYALSFVFTPVEQIQAYLRVNERSSNRRVGGANGGALNSFFENGGQPDELSGGLRNTSTEVFGFRAVDPGVTDRLSPNFFNPSQAAFDFTDPVTGAPVRAQRVRPGVDVAVTALPNPAFGHDPTLADTALIGLNDLDGDDLLTDTNGFQNEFFDQQAVAFDLSWELSDRALLKYIFGYTDFFYDRTTDNDLTSSTSFDSQFYVSQENDNRSYELQLFLDLGENLSITTGLFAYRANITQRGDTFETTGSSRFSQTPNYGVLEPVLAGILQFIGTGDGTPVDLFSARRFAIDQAVAPGATILRQGFWQGDSGTRSTSGPSTVGSFSEYETRTKRTSYAAYTQAEWSVSDQWSLTAGLRWARDDLRGEENLYLYDESIIDFNAILGLSLGQYNVLSGALVADQFGNPQLDANNQPIPTGAEPVRFQGIPLGSSLYRELERSDQDVTWRINLDFQPNEDTLIYLSQTAGYRGGGFNLGFFSFSPQYEPETLIAYELGYKGRLADGRLQLNAAAYFYDYRSVHTFASGLDGTNNISTSVFADPEAEILGFDVDAIYLVGSRLTLGINGSFTESEYTNDFFIIDTNNPARPESLFVNTDLPININGNRILRVPRFKAGGFARYLLPLGDSGEVEFFTSISWIDSVSFSPFEDPGDEAPAYTRWDARVAWNSADQRWGLAMFVNNITNEVGIRQLEPASEASNFRRSGALTFPRQFGVEASIRFGKL